MSRAPQSFRRKRTWSRGDFKGKLSKDIKPMMYGFGDEWDTDPETLSLMENIMIEYLQSLLEGASEISKLRGRLDKDCVAFWFAKDKRKCDRI
ncbi:unnamed protein product, partial [Heterosigma akashiwo]